MDTIGTQLGVLYREVSLKFRDGFVHSSVVGTANSVLIRELSSFRVSFIERFCCSIRLPEPDCCTRAVLSRLSAATLVCCGKACTTGVSHGGVCPINIYK